MTARRAVGLASTHVRRLGSKTEATSHLLELLRRNPELSEEDAKAELRWMRQAAPIRPEDGSTERGRLKAMVERRSRGEPLQYILGE
jgi:methylase of polypeptide subunit release factors